MELPKRLSRTVIYESEWINLYTDKVELSSGKIIDGISLLPITLYLSGLYDIR